MSQPNETREPVSNMERLKDEAADCGPGCGCHADGAAGWTRWVTGAVIVVIAGVLVVRVVTKTDDSATEVSAAAFAVPAGAANVETDTAAMESTADAVTTTAAQAPQPDGSAASTTDTPPPVQPEPPVTAEDQGAASADAPTDSKSNAPVCGKPIGSLGDLNRLAMDKDGVFVFLAGKDPAKARAAITVVEKAAATIGGRGMKMGLFTMEDGSRDYTSLTKQASPPAVIAMVKGRGASAVSGADITEAKLMQAFVAASSGGGCGTSSGGCGPVGCP